LAALQISDAGLRFAKALIEFNVAEREFFNVAQQDITALEHIDGAALVLNDTRSGIPGSSQYFLM
jgi:hypothetical protein